MTAVLIVLALTGIFFFCYHIVGLLDRFLKSIRNQKPSAVKPDHFQDDEAVLYQSAFETFMNQKK